MRLEEGCTGGRGGVDGGVNVGTLPCVSTVEP